MQLSLLQSRLAASLVASCLLILLYLVLFQPNFALAAELSEPLPVILDHLDFPTSPAPRSPLDPTYEAEFWPFDKSVIGRQQADIIKLTNDEPKPMNVEQGTSQHFVFELPAVSSREAEDDRLELRSDHNASWELNAGAGAGAAEHEVAGEQEEQKLATRQASRRVYISANTCLQPQPEDPSETKGEPSQLALYVSTTATNQRPGPLGDNETQTKVVFEEGAVMYNFTTDKEVYIAVHADVSSNFSGIYNFKIAASIDSYYYSYHKRGDAELILVDTDSQGALLRTHDLTNSADAALEQKTTSAKPYALFAHNKEDRRINGVKRSYCGLYNYAQIASTTSGRQTNTVISSMAKTKMGKGNSPGQQFFFSGLNSSAEYITFLARDGMDGNDVAKRQTAAERGPQIFAPMNFTTKSNHGNCALVIDLEFCDHVAYAVPSNPNNFNSIELAKLYDNHAAAVYANFAKSLAQIACEAPASQRYSLARNCTDCEAAYKDWLCTVTIPRCEDFSTPDAFLQPRAIVQPFPDGSTLSAADLADLAEAGVTNTKMFNSSRNPLIDQLVKPGPYKELLPCDDLCYKLVRNCPAAMGFGCPLPGGTGFAGNYVKHDEAAGLTCNFPGSAHFASGGGRRAVGWGVMMVGVVVGLGLVVV